MNFHMIAFFLETLDFLMSLTLFAFLYYQFKYKKRCKFEVLYVTLVGSVTDLLKISITNFVPATFDIEDSSVTVYWSRWAGWLITCPVLLFHLSNLPGNEQFNVNRTMYMLISYQIMMIMGITSSMIEILYWKLIFWFLGLISLLCIFSFSKQIFKESYETMPEKAYTMLKLIQVTFYSSWIGFSMVYFFSPEGLNVLNVNTSKALFALFDILSKNVYCIFGWHLRWNILRKMSEKGCMRVLISDEDYLRKAYLKDTLFRYDPSIIVHTENKIRNVEALLGYNVIFYNESCRTFWEENELYDKPDELNNIVMVFYDIVKTDREIEQEDNNMYIDERLKYPISNIDLDHVFSKWFIKNNNKKSSFRISGCSYTPINRLSIGDINTQSSSVATKCEDESSSSNNNVSELNMELCSVIRELKEMQSVSLQID